MFGTVEGVKHRYRLVVVCVVVVSVVGMGVHYDSVFADRWPYPTEDELATDYDDHVGERTLLFGTVESVDDGTARVRIAADAGEYTLRVQSVDAAVEPGGVVQLLGEVRPGGVLVAERVVVVESSPGAALYKYGVSLVGAALVLVVFFRHWRVDIERLELEARDG